VQRSEKLRAGKLAVDAGLVRRLVDGQFPRWAALPIRPVADDGWDNWTFRLGDRLKVRLPSADGYAEQPEKEWRWLPRLAPFLPAAVPRPAGLGQPAEGYPWHWSVQDWLEGTPVRFNRLDDPLDLARQVARFLRALQAIETLGGPPPGPHNFFRGAPLAGVYGEEARRSIDAVAGDIDAAGAHAVLDAAEAAGAALGPPAWVHGDVAPGNLLLHGGRLAAVIDFGCLAVGDPACDLVIAWAFFNGAARAVFRAEVAADAAMWARARGWALWKAALILAGGAAPPPAEAPPRSVIAAVIAEHRRH
jgi:aminoglycoside phosphotransferase (APT) family kinase protein